MNTTQIYQAIAAVDGKVNDLSRKLDGFIKMLNGKTQSDVEFVAMMTDVDLDQDTAFNAEVE